MTSFSASALVTCALVKPPAKNRTGGEDAHVDPGNRRVINDGPGGEAVGNVGDFPPAGQPNMIDGEAPGNRGDGVVAKPKAAKPKVKRSITADMVMPAREKFLTEGNYQTHSQSRGGAYVKNVEESRVNIGTDIAGNPNVHTGTDATANPGPYVGNIEESVINVGQSPDLTQGIVPAKENLLDPYVGNIEESTININGGGPKEIPRLLSESAGASNVPHVSIVEESVVNVGSGFDKTNLPMPKQDMSGGIDALVKNIEESTVNIAGKKYGSEPGLSVGDRHYQAGTNTRPLVNNVEESTINIGGRKPTSDMISPTGVSDSLESPSSYVKNIEESTINIGNPSKTVYPGRVDKFTVDKTSPGNGPYLNKIEESTINIGGPGKDTILPSGSSSPSITNIEESIVNVDNTPGVLDRQPASGNGPYVKNIEESTINVGGSGQRTPGAVEGLLFNGKDPRVHGIEESTINIGSSDSLNTPGTAYGNKFQQIPDATNGASANVQNIGESVINIGKQPYPGKVLPLDSTVGQDASVRNIEESTINIGSQGGYPAGGLTGIGDALAPLQRDGPGSSAGPYVNNIEESTINIGHRKPRSGHLPLDGKSTGMFVNKIEESIVNLDSPPVKGAGSLGSEGLTGNAYLKPTSDGSAKLGAVVTNIEESVVNTGNLSPLSKAEPGKFRGLASVKNIEESTININTGSSSKAAADKMYLQPMKKGFIATSNKDAVVKNIEESVINIGRAPGGQPLDQNPSSYSSPDQDVPDASRSKCVKYPYRDEGDSLVFEGIDYNCEL